MVLSALEPLANPADGSTATASGFGQPVFDFIKALTGNATGNPDTNGGAPIVVRSHQTGMLSYTNAQGITTYPGILPASGYISSAGALSYVVPTGTMLVVTGLQLMAALGNGATITVTDTTTSWVLGSVFNNIGTLQLNFPLVLDQNWVLTTPQFVRWYGHKVVRDTAITPVVYSVSNAGGSGTYSVPVGKTLFVYNCFNALSVTTARLMLGDPTTGTPIALCTTTAGPAPNIDSFNGISGQHPPCFQSPSTLTGSTASGVTFSGILF